MGLEQDTWLTSWIAAQAGQEQGALTFCCFWRLRTKAVNAAEASRNTTASSVHLEGLALALATPDAENQRHLHGSSENGVRELAVAPEGSLNPDGSTKWLPRLCAMEQPQHATVFACVLRQA